jgi:hypothetical protein
MSRTLSDSMAAAQQGVRLESAARDKRIREVSTLLHRVERLSTEAERLGAALAGVR